MVLAALAGSACKTSKKAAKSKKQETAQVVAPAVDTAVVKTDTDKGTTVDYSQYMPYMNREIVFNTFSGKTKMSYSDPSQNLDFVANIRIKNDEAIWVSISAVGGLIEPARVYITPDSLKLVDKLNKVAYIKPYSYIQSMVGLDVDFHTLQNLLIGNVLIKDGKVVSAKTENNALTIMSVKEEYQQGVTFNLSDSMLTGTSLFNPKNGMNAMISLANYQSDAGIPFANNRNYEIFDGTKTIQLKMEYVKKEFNGTVDMPFSIPNNFSRR